MKGGATRHSYTIVNEEPVFVHLFVTRLSPRGLTFTRWGCCGLRYKATELAYSFLFRSCVFFCLYGSFNCFSFHKFFRQLSPFSPLFFRSCFCLTGPLKHMYLFLKVSFIVVINLLTVRVVWAPQMILQPVFSIFTVLHCPLGLAELQACPIRDVVFPPLLLSALSSSPFHCALQDGFGLT